MPAAPSVLPDSTSPDLRSRRPAIGRPVRALGAALVVGALALAGCSAPKHQAEVPSGSTTSSPDASASSDAPAELARFYDQQLDWTSCGDLECTTAIVPLDWAAPEGDVIELAVTRSPATSGEAIGSLLINPGGPGGSGVDAVSWLVTGRLSESVVEAYDVVGFDPRGVGGSAPITCVDGPQMDEIVSTDPDYTTQAGIDAAMQMYGDLGAGCLERTGALLGHVDTVSAARDMDVLRAALGDETLTYLGYSYGTQLGATYAALFPTKVGRLVLDGALDPTLSYDEVALGQAAGFESALRAYVADCQGGSGCPLTGSVDDGMSQIKALLDSARRSPLSTGDDDRPLTGVLAFTGIAYTLYSSTSWPYLTQGLAAALQDDDGSVLLQLADAYYERSPDGTYSGNSTEAFWSIGCADDRAPADTETMRASAAEIEAAAPTVGFYFGFGGVVCARWPVPEVGGLDSYAAEGAAPIVVIGTTNDPATPYAWAESLSTTLSSAVLLTFEGEGHTAYGVANECLDGAVDAYLLDGTVPDDGTRC